MMDTVDFRGPKVNFFSIAGPRFWNVAEAAFVEEDEIPEGARVAYLEDAEGKSTVALLRETLLFNHLPLGELATEGDKIEKLITDNRDYLMRLMMLSVLGLEIPDEDMEHYVKVRMQAEKFSGSALTSFLKG